MQLPPASKCSRRPHSHILTPSHVLPEALGEERLLVEHAVAELWKNAAMTPSESSTRLGKSTPKAWPLMESGRRVSIGLTPRSDDDRLR